nr:hypothetical protein [Tanacetum cinerariifolium]
MQKKKNDVKEITTLLLSLPDEHQLRFKVEQNDLNQKFLTSLASEWLIHIIVWRNRSDLDTMSLDDLYNHLKVYESEVQKKTEQNSQNMAFISSAKHNSGNEDGNTAYVPTASTNVPIGHKPDEDDMEEIDIKWNMALLSMWANKFWKRTGKKISIQGSDVAGFDKSKVECFNCYKIGHFAREFMAPRSQDRGRRDNFRQGSKSKEQAPKALMTIDGVGWDWSYMENDGEDHALDLSWTGLLKCADDTVTDYSRPSPTVESTSKEDQNRNPSISENVASTITPKPFIKFVKPKDSQSKMRSPYGPLCVPTVNRYFPLANRKFSTGSRNFPTANRKFSTTSRKFPTGSTKSPTADMGMKGKAVKPS